MNEDVRLLKMQILLMEKGLDREVAEDLAKELARIADMEPQLPIVVTPDRTYPIYPTYPTYPTYPSSPIQPWYTITTTDGTINEGQTEFTVKS